MSACAITLCLRCFRSALDGAPDALSRGFFVSQLGFYDVQESLLRDTFTAIGLTLGVAILVLALYTKSLAITSSGLD